MFPGTSRPLYEGSDPSGPGGAPRLFSAKGAPPGCEEEPHKRPKTTAVTTPDDPPKRVNNTTNTLAQAYVEALGRRGRGGGGTAQKPLASSSRTFEALTETDGGSGALERLLQCAHARYANTTTMDVDQQ